MLTGHDLPTRHAALQLDRSRYIVQAGIATKLTRRFRKAVTKV